MDFATNAQIIYSGSGEHEIRSLEKAQWLSALSKSDNKKLAEWAIDRIAFNDALHDHNTRAGFRLESNPVHDYFDTLHRDYEQDLRENYFEQDPVISDEEAQEMLFRTQIAELLKDIPQTIEVDISG